MNKLSKIFLVVIIVLLLAIGGGVIYTSITFGTEKKLTSQIGNNIKIKTLTNASVVSSVLIDGEVLPEDEIEQNISIYAPEDSDIYFRVSVYFSNQEGKRTYLDILTMPNFTKIDNYYYYTKSLTKQTMTKFSNKIILPKADDFMLFSDEVYSLNFVVETFNDKDLAMQIWKQEF